MPVKYTVEDGDTLPSIAVKFFGELQVRRWLDIYKLNKQAIDARRAEIARQHMAERHAGGEKGEGVQMIEAGMVLDLPADAARRDEDAA